MIKSTGLSVAGARAEFFGRLEKVATFPWQQFVMTVPSDKESEKHRWLGGLPQMREFGTGRMAKGLRSESYDVVNRKYESTIEWDRDEIADDQTGQIRMRIRQMADAAQRHKSYLLSLLFANGGSAGFVAYDGKTFFATDHVSGDSGTQDNALTATAAAATKTTSECKVALQAAIAAGMSYKDDQGEPLNEAATGVVVVTPPSLFFPMSEAVSAAQVSATNNVLTKLNVEVLTFSRLTLGTDFFTCFLGDSDSMPFMFQEREKLEFKALEADGDSDGAFMRDKGTAGCRARYAMAYGYWQKCVRTRFNN